ncbi:MAG: PKD domain-containing protein [Promethearchaeota archaeon]
MLKFKTRFCSGIIILLTICLLILPCSLLNPKAKDEKGLVMTEEKDFFFPNTSNQDLGSFQLGFDNWTWGGTDNDRGWSVWGDGTYIYTTGCTESFGALNYDLLLVKWDPAGNIVWNKTWGGMGYDYGYSVWGDGTYIYTAGKTDNGSNTDLLLVQWATNGTVLWNRTWGGTGGDIGHSVWGDGTYIYTAGYTRNFGASTGDLLLVQWATNGTVLWNRTWGGTEWDYGWSIWGDGTYIYTAGFTESFDALNYDLLLVQWDTDGNLVWNRTWGGTGDDWCYSVWGDGTYIYTTGYTESPGYNDDVVLVRWNATGSVEWSRTWGGSSTDYGCSVWGDGTYLYTTGFTSSFGALIGDLLLVKWDATGNIIWNRTWGGDGYDFGCSVWGDGTFIYTVGYNRDLITLEEDLALVRWNENLFRTMGETGNDVGNSVWSDGTFIYTTGRTNSFGALNYDLLLVKWDATGNMIWYRTWGGTGMDYGNSVWGDGTYLYTTGFTRDLNTSDDDLMLIKWDATGNMVWNKTWGGTGGDIGYSVWGDGTYLYTSGSTRSFGALWIDLLLLQWDTDGNVVWNRTWGGAGYEYGLSVWGDGTYIYTTGSTSSFGAITEDLLLVQWDAGGNILWNRTWGGFGYDVGYSVWGDGTYIYTTGYINRFGASSYDLLLMQWDPAGNIVWNQTWGGTGGDEGLSVWGDGTYIYTTGLTSSFGALSNDLLLMQWDPTGNIILNQTWGGFGYDVGYSVWGDGTYIYTTGSTDSFDALNYDLLLVQWDFVPIASLEVNITNIIANEFVQFSFTGQEGSPSASYQWNFGDETPNSTLRDPIHQYTSAGNFTVTLTVSDVDGDTDSIAIVDYIDVIPDLPANANWNASLRTILVGDEVDFTFTGNEGNTPTNFQWNFGDGTGIFSDRDITHAYITAGNFTVFLAVSDIDGDFDNVTRVNFITVLTPSGDFDGDGLTNEQEIDIYGTNATNRDTDGDEWDDKVEIDAGTDPLDPLDHPSKPGPSPSFWEILLQEGILIPIIGAIVSAFTGIIVKKQWAKRKKKKADTSKKEKKPKKDQQ